MSNKFKYATIGALFVNVSIGGTLTHFAAPPVLMVATKYGWGIQHMILNFGWKAALAVLINSLILVTLFSKELKGEQSETDQKQGSSVLKPTWWVILIHLLFLAGVVMTSHNMVIFLALLLFFLGWCKCSAEYQEKIKLTEALLVGFFLAGLVTLGAYQDWWLKPILSKMSEIPLFIGAIGLTAITDNAALTYLGSLVELTDPQKYAIVAGAVTGGGLTVIANAPNPAGYGILKPCFGEDGISPINLLLGAIPFTFIASLCMWFLPSLGG